MKYRTVVVQCASLLLLLVQSSNQHDYKTNGISGSSSHSFSSASASSFASANSYSSSSSFGGKTGNLINEVGGPLGNLLSGAKAGAGSSLAGAQAGASAFASAGAHAGIGTIGSGADSKASAGSKSTAHGLGVGGGIGLDNDGSLEGTGKYGSAAIKGNCGGGSCSSGSLGFGGLGSYSGSSNVGFNGGNSGISSNTNTYGGSGSAGTYSNGNSNFGISAETPGSNTLIGTGLSGCGGSSGGCNQDNTGSGSAGCSGASGGCDNQYPSNIQPLPNGSGFAAGSVQGTQPSGVVPGISSPCGSSNADCAGGITSVQPISPSGNANPDYLIRPIEAGGSVHVTKPIISPGFGTLPSLSTGNIPLNNYGKVQVPQSTGFYSPGSSGIAIGTVPPYKISSVGKPDYSTGSTAQPNSCNTGLCGSSGFITGTVQVGKPTTDLSYGRPISSTGQIPLVGIHAISEVGHSSPGSHYSGPFPGPSFSIYHSIPASSVPAIPSIGSSASAAANAGSAVSSGKHHVSSSNIGLGLSIDSNKPSGLPTATIYEGHYTGPFPGPFGSIHESKPTSVGKPSVSFETSKPSYTGTGSTANAQAGATASAQAGTTANTGTHYTGPFPGPAGNIHHSINTPGSADQNKPDAVGKPSGQYEPSKPSYASAGSTAGAQAGTSASTGTHYAGPFPGPAGNIHHSINTPGSAEQNKPGAVGKPSGQYEPSKPSYASAGSTASAQAGTTASTGTHYAGPFPGPSGSIYQSTKPPGSYHENKPVSTGKPSGQYEPSKPSYAGAGSTANAQAGTTTGTGIHYTGPFPGPSGNIHQSVNVPGSSYENKPVTSGQFELTKPSYAGTESSANAQAGATASTGTHYTGPFPGPSGSIHDSTNAPASHSGTFGSSNAGSHYTGKFAGATGNDYTTTVTTTPTIASVTYSSGLAGSTARVQAGSTVFTEKPIINIIPISIRSDDIVTTEHPADVSKTTSGYSKQNEVNNGAYAGTNVQSGAGSDCAYGGCSSPVKIPNYESGIQSSKPELSSGCSGSLCGSPGLQSITSNGNSDGSNSGLNVGSCEGSSCKTPNYGSDNQSPQYESSGCSGLSCGSPTIHSSTPGGNSVGSSSGLNVGNCAELSCKYPNYSENQSPQYEPSSGCSGLSCSSPTSPSSPSGGNSAGSNSYGLNVGGSPSTSCSGPTCNLPNAELGIHGGGSGAINVAGSAGSSTNTGGLGSTQTGCSGYSCNDGKFINALKPGNIGADGIANANAGSIASAGSSSGSGAGDTTDGTYNGRSNGCGGLKCGNGNLGSNAFSGTSSGSFGGSFSSAKSGSSSYSGTKGGASSHSFATSGSSSGGFGFPLAAFGGAQSGAYSSSFASAKSSASSGHY